MAIYLLTLIEGSETWVQNLATRPEHGIQARTDARHRQILTSTSHAVQGADLTLAESPIEKRHFIHES